MAKKPFMEMDLEEFEDNGTNDSVINEPSLDFDFDEDTTGDSTESDVETQSTDDVSTKPETENISDEYAKYLETVKRYKTNPQEAINDLKEKVKPYTLPDDFVNGITTDLSKYDNAEISKDGKVIFCLEEFNNIARIICNYDELVLDKKLIDLGGDGWGNSLVLNLDNESYSVYYHDRFKNGENITIQVASSFDELLSNLKTGESTESNETPEIPETPDFDNPDDTSTTTQEGYVMESWDPYTIDEAKEELKKTRDTMLNSSWKDRFDIKKIEREFDKLEKDVLSKMKTTHDLLRVEQGSFYLFPKSWKDNKKGSDIEYIMKVGGGLREEPHFLYDKYDYDGRYITEGYVQEGMFDAGFNNLRSKIAQALGEKFKVTNVVKGMGGKDKFDITEQDVEDPTKTTVESTGTACNVTVRGDGKIGRKIGITLSSALDKILEIVKKPDLVLESGFYNISRNVNGGFYQEADDETADDEDFDIDAELDELNLNDESTSDDDTKKDTDETPTKETNDTETEEIETDIDLDSFGSDTSDVQNEYDQKDVDALNKLIAAESEAINDYFDASKDTRNEDLRTLFSDIGHEERFHLEQLMYSKSILTGEKYEPRDPEVKKEYEELISNGMDEDEAISTAVEKHRIDGGNIDLDEVEQEAAYIYDNLRNSEILTEYCCKAIEQRRIKNALMSAETKFVVEAFIQESLENVSQASKKDVKIKSPIDILIKGLTLSVKGIIRMGEVTRDALHKNNLKNARRKEWIKKHGIVELFRSGVALYFWNDKNNVYDINLACRYVDMLYRLSKDIGAKCGVRLTQDAQRKPIENPLKYSSIEDGINILRGVVLTKTKIVVNENNKDIIANTFFGYTPDKVGVAVTHGKDGKPVNDSANIYNRVDIALVLTKDYSEVSNAVLGALKRLEGDTNSVFYKNRALFDKSVSQMEFVVKKYQEFVSCLAHDLKVMTKLDNGMLQETRNRDEAEQNGGKK